MSRAGTAQLRGFSSALAHRTGKSQGNIEHRPLEHGQNQQPEQMEGQSPGEGQNLEKPLSPLSPTFPPHVPKCHLHRAVKPSRAVKSPQGWAIPPGLGNPPRDGHPPCPCRGGHSHAVQSAKSAFITISTASDEERLCT